MQQTNYNTRYFSIAFYYSFLSIQVNDIHLVPKSSSSQDSLNVQDWNLVISQYDHVKLHTPGCDQSLMSTLHHVALQAVSAIDCSSHQVAVGVRADMVYQVFIL